MRRALGSTLIAMACLVAHLAGQDSLPQPVARAFHQSYPAAVVLHVSKERRDGRVVYEIESRDGTTRRDLIYDPAGAVIEIEEMIPADSVPGAVRAAIERDLRSATLVRAERVTSGTVVLFEVQLRVGQRTRYVTYDPAGVRKE